MKNKGIWVSNVLIHLALLLFAGTVVFGFALILSVSLTSQSDIIEHGFRVITFSPDFSSYEYVLNNLSGIVRAYGISIVYSAVGTALSVMIMSMIAYALSRPQFKLRKVLSFYVFFTMLFSGGLTPTYILITQYLKLQNTIWVLILPGLMNCFHVILLRTFFAQLPDSLFESAKLDGASEFRIYRSIALPLSKPALATVTFMGVITRWNDWFTPKLYIDKRSLYPLQYLLQSMLANVQFAIDMIQHMPAAAVDIHSIPRENLRMAMVVVTLAPMLFVFIFFQKYFVKGITVGSIK